MSMPVSKRVPEHMVCNVSTPSGVVTLPPTNVITVPDYWMTRIGGAWVNQATSLTPQYLSQEIAGPGYGDSLYRTFIGHRVPWDMLMIAYNPTSNAAVYVGNMDWQYYNSPGYGISAHESPVYYTGGDNRNGFRNANPYTEFYWSPGGALSSSRPADWYPEKLFGQATPLYWRVLTYPLPTAPGIGSGYPRIEIFQDLRRVIERVTFMDIGGDGTLLDGMLRSEFGLSGGDVFGRFSSKTTAGTKMLNLFFPGGMKCRMNRNLYAAIASNSTSGVGRRVIHVTYSKEA